MNLGQYNPGPWQDHLGLTLRYIISSGFKPFGLTLPSTLELILPSTLGKDCMDLEEIIWIMQTIWGPPWWWVMIGKGGQCEMRRGKTTQLLQWWPLSTHYRHLSALSSVGVIRFTSVLAHTDVTLTGS